MHNQQKTLSILSTLVALFSLPIVAAADTCLVDVDTPALVTVESTSGITLDLATDDTVILETSPTHMVIAVGRPGSLIFETPTCELQTTITRVEVHQQVVPLGTGNSTRALATSFHPIELATKEEDHDIDPDPDHPMQDGPAPSLLTLIRLDSAVPNKEEDHDIDPDPDVHCQPVDRETIPGRGMPNKEEDHDIDPDPDVHGSDVDLKTILGCGLPNKEEDHDIDPDPDRQLGDGTYDWAQDWNMAAALIRQLGPGWYFVVKGGDVTQEILIDPRN